MSSGCPWIFRVLIFRELSYARQNYPQETMSKVNMQGINAKAAVSTTSITEIMSQSLTISSSPVVPFILLCWVSYGQ